NQKKSSILLLTYRKHESLTEILHEIIKYHPTKLYIAQNNAKNENEKKLINQVASIINQFNFPFETEYIIHQQYLPISESIITSINKAFEKEDKLIILEDDVVPN